MEESARVLSRAAGPLNAKLMFIGEAPGRLGADTYEIPFHGDKAGHNFEELLGFAGLDRSRVFITNSVLCNPKAENGTNATPKKIEISNCSGYLKEQIDLLNPEIVVTLGGVALEALNQIELHNLSLSAHVRSMQNWYGRNVIPLYHPGARAMIHRSMANQRSDYQFVAERLRKLGSTNRQSFTPTKRTVSALASEILLHKGAVSYFGLHKLLYLVECEAWKQTGHNLTDAFFIRQKDGPYCTDLHLAKLRKALPNLVVTGGVTKPILQLGQGGMFDGEFAALSNEFTSIVLKVVNSVDGLSDAELKSRVYLSTPMRRMLRFERTSLVNLYNSPISFGEHLPAN